MDTAFWDIGNAVFEGVGAVLTWQNVRMLLRHRIIRGIDWRVTAFWATWGLWNLGFYGPGMGLWLSWWMGVVLVAGNITWVALAIRYTERETSMNVERVAFWFMFAAFCGMALVTIQTNRDFESLRRTTTSALDLAEAQQDTIIALRLRNRALEAQPPVVLPRPEGGCEIPESPDMRSL